LLKIIACWDGFLNGFVVVIKKLVIANGVKQSFEVLHSPLEIAASLCSSQ
jgi:hypothetical protein